MAARARSRCSSISRTNPASSTDRPFSDGDLGGQLEGKAVGVVEPKRIFGRNLSTGLEHLVQELGAGLEGAREALLLGPQQRGHGGLTGDQLGVDIAQQLDHPGVQPRQKLARRCRSGRPATSPAG